MTKMLHYTITDDEVKRCKLKYKNENDIELHEKFVDYLHDGFEGANYKSLVYALKTIDFLKLYFPNSRWILECYRNLKFFNYVYSIHPEYEGSWANEC